MAVLAATARTVDLLCHWLDQAVRAAVGSMMAVIFVLLMVQILMLYVIHVPLAWIEELTAFLASYLTLWGASVCLRAGSHVLVDTFYRLYPEPLRRLVTVVIYGIVLFFCYALYVGGMRLAELGGHELSYSGYSSLFWPRMAVVTGALLIALQTLNLLFQEVVSWITGEPYEGGLRSRGLEGG
jgi:TRAP-type transport system small permease protein